MRTTLALSEEQHAQLARHLFPGDGKEAAAILVCGRSGQQRLRLSVTEIITVPHSDCTERTDRSITWPGEWLEHAIDRAELFNHSLILTHSHPGGYLNFSATDNESDIQVMPGLLYAFDDSSIPHGSAIMTPDGRIKARLYNQAGEPREINQVVSIGIEISQLARPSRAPTLPFTDNMRSDLANYCACVVGVSGTGSLTAELFARSGVGRLILIDFDRTEFKNLDRIIHSTVADANLQSYKTKSMADAIKLHHPNCEVVTLETSIDHEDAVRAVGDADVIFCCVDSMEGRHWCNVLSSAYLLPLIDLGVSIPTRELKNNERCVSDACARVDYIFPGGTSLSDRQVITSEGLQREYLQRVAPETVESLDREGYVIGIQQEAPPVMSLNMVAASFAVNEWLARCYPYRLDGNSHYARTLLSLAAMEQEHFTDSDFLNSNNDAIGLGLADPRLPISLAKSTPVAA